MINVIRKAFQAWDDWARGVAYRSFGLTYQPPEPYSPPIDPAQQYDVALIGRGRPGQIRRLRIERNGGRFTRRDWQRLLARDKCCLCCGSTTNLSMDHIIPVARGGRHEYSNAQVLCGSCNSRKGTKVIDYRKVK